MALKLKRMMIKMMKHQFFKIHQVRNTREHGFMGFDMMQELNIPIELENYEMVYHGSIEFDEFYRENNLNQIYEKFNINHPKEYKGRSVSVGDIIEIFGMDNTSRFFFVDSFGFKELKKRTVLFE